MNNNIIKAEPDCVDPSLNEDSGLAAAYDLVVEHGDDFGDLTPDSQTDMSTSLSRSNSFDDSGSALPSLSQSFLEQDNPLPSSTLHYGASPIMHSSQFPGPINLMNADHRSNWPQEPLMSEHRHIPLHTPCMPMRSNGVPMVPTSPGLGVAPVESVQRSTHLESAVSRSLMESIDNAIHKAQVVELQKPVGESTSHSSELATGSLPVASASSNPVPSLATTSGYAAESSAVTASSVCAICGDTASGRHYGVISCEGCKGFFKRSVRKQLQFTCRGSGQCPVDRIKRTRCQHCRFERCLAMGMKREAVQEERHRYYHGDNKVRNQQIKTERPGLVTVDELSDQLHGQRVTSSNDNYTVPSASHPSAKTEPVEGEQIPLSSTTSLTPSNDDSTVESLCVESLSLAHLLIAEFSTDVEFRTTSSGKRVYVDIGDNDLDPLIIICQSVEMQITRLVCWARQLPPFNAPFFSEHEQLCLLRSAWPELLLLSASYNSIPVRDGLLLSNGRHLSRSKASKHSLGPLVDRIQSELVSRFRDMQLERIELAMLRAIILFNPEANDLVHRNRAESVRENLYAALHSYSTTSHPQDTARFTKLLLRLPSLRSIAQKCMEHLVFVKLAAEDPSARRLINLVEHGIWPNDAQVFSTPPSTSRQYSSLLEPNGFTGMSTFVPPSPFQSSLTGLTNMSCSTNHPTTSVSSDIRDIPGSIITQNNNHIKPDENDAPPDCSMK